jgi:hypothetical protein
LVGEIIYRRPFRRVFSLFSKNERDTPCVNYIRIYKAIGEVLINGFIEPFLKDIGNFFFGQTPPCLRSNPTASSVRPHPHSTMTEPVLGEAMLGDVKRREAIFANPQNS